jgi:GNAT superfamily N-acetyltransferase
MGTRRIKFRQPFADDTYDNQVEKVIKIVQSIFTDAFGMDTWTEEKIRKYLQTRPNLFLGYIERDPILYCTISLQNYRDFSDYLWVDTIAVIKRYQNRGIGGQTLAFLIRQYPNINWIGARTQNPGMVRLIQKFCYLVFPIDVSYEHKDGKAIFDFSKGKINECTSANEQGVCKGVYSEGRLGDYPSRDDLKKINEMFVRIGCVRREGDAAIVIGEIER